MTSMEMREFIKKNEHGFMEMRQLIKMSMRSWEQRQLSPGSW